MCGGGGALESPFPRNVKPWDEGVINISSVLCIRANIPQLALVL